MDIAELDITDRVYAALVKEGMNTAEQICLLSIAEVDRFPGIGKVGLKNLIEALVKAGYSGPTIYKYGRVVKPRVKVPMGRAVV